MAFTPEVKSWIIYKITNPCGRIYIGKSFNYKKRLQSYRYLHCKSQPALYQSLKKYGFENHVIICIDAFDSAHKYASDKEMFWIRTYMSNKCKWPHVNGLNLTDGGEGSIGCKYTEEQRTALSERMKGTQYRLGKYHNSDTRKKISETKKQKGDGKGKKWSEEARRKFTVSRTGIPMSEASKKHLSNINKGRKYPNRKQYDDEYKRSMNKYKEKKVGQFNTTGELIREYNSGAIAAKEIGGSKSGVYNCARGVIKTYKGYTFKYT